MHGNRKQSILMHGNRKQSLMINAIVEVGINIPKRKMLKREIRLN